MLRRELVWLILTGGIQDENKKKSQITDFMRRTATLTRRDRNKHSEWGGIAGLTQKGMRDVIYQRRETVFHRDIGVYLGVKTCEVFLCFVAIVRVKVYYVDFIVFFVLRPW